MLEDTNSLDGAQLVTLLIDTHSPKWQYCKALTIQHVCLFYLIIIQLSQRVITKDKFMVMFEYLCLNILNTIVSRRNYVSYVTCVLLSLRISVYFVLID